MKVVLATFVYERELGGGAAQVVHALAHHLISQGIEVVVITTHNERRIAVTRVNGVTVIRFFPWNLYWVAHKERHAPWKRVLWQFIDIWNPHTYLVVRRILEQVEPDIMHVHKLRGLSPSLWRGAQVANVKTILQTCHDYELMSPEGTLSGRLGALAQQNIGPLRPYQRLRARWSRAVTGVTAPTSYALRTIIDRGFFPTSIKQVVPNSHGLTSQQLEAQYLATSLRSPHASPDINLLYLGRLDPLKGVEILCAAFTEIARQYPQARLHIAGWGTLATSLAQQYHWNSRVIFHGAVFGEKKQQLLEACDCMVVPSTWPEVFGIVITEAYAHGKPVIASAIGGVPELIEPGVTGWLVPPGDQGALYEALAGVIEHLPKLWQMAPACFAAAQHYTADGVAKQYIELYERAVKYG